jgi:hypothetical protein
MRTPSEGHRENAGGSKLEIEAAAWRSRRNRRLSAAAGKVQVVRIRRRSEPERSIDRAFAPVSR